jgi:hypothetical protein
MRSRRSILVTILISGLAVSGARAAGSRTAENAGGRRSSPVVDYVQQIDGPIAAVTSPDGRGWAVWAYRASGEFDIAIASRTASGAWNPPTFLGRRDGVDQIDPTLAIDANGTLYLAFATKSPARIAVATLRVGSSVWTAPVIVAAEEGASFPALRMVRDRLVVAYRTLRGVAIIDVPVAAPQTSMGIHDSPDTVDPLGFSAPGSNGSGSGGGSGGDNGGGNGNGGGDK